MLDQYCVGDYCFGFSSEPVPGTEGKGKGRNKQPKTRYIIEWNEVGWVVKIFYWFVIERRPLRWIAARTESIWCAEGSPLDNPPLVPPAPARSAK